MDLVGRDGSALEQAERVLDEETFKKIESLVGKVVSVQKNYFTVTK